MRLARKILLPPRQLTNEIPVHSKTAQRRSERVRQRRRHAIERIPVRTPQQDNPVHPLPPDPHIRMRCRQRRVDITRMRHKDTPNTTRRSHHARRTEKTLNRRAKGRGIARIKPPCHRRFSCNRRDHRPARRLSSTLASPGTRTSRGNFGKRSERSVDRIAIPVQPRHIRFEHHDIAPPGATLGVLATLPLRRIVLVSHLGLRRRATHAHTARVRASSRDAH